MAPQRCLPRSTCSTVRSSVSASSATPTSSGRKFLRQIDRETPKDKTLHLIADNYATHKHPVVQDWLAKHPRFVFPQLKGLGRSAMAQHYGIASREEALAYWRHPVLGPRLKECTRLVLAVDGRTARQIFGTPDDLKFRSSMTLFAGVVPDEAGFAHTELFLPCP